ncbi:MAG: DUF4136 domain-containing protein, partial [Bacteroidota bacterium]|nr:DUF4136 domain-containing protein [Bacteroidota bacterium]
MRFRILGAFAIATLFMMGGCASTAHVEKDDATDFHKYKSFSWIERKEDDKKASDITEQNIRTAVNQELQKTGWREVKDNPDILLSYDVLVERNVKQERNPVYTRPYSRVYYNPYTRRYGTIFYPSEFIGYENNQTAVREGTITISMIDTNTDKTVWQGWTTGEVNSRNLT